ncbi:MAG TPA: glycosyl hydrolase, partial [Thermoanaerobaculia bacterium]
FSQDGGAKWTQIKGKFPTIAVRDLWIQRQHDDLDIATFGRGFWVLDDYTPLRTPAANLASRDVTLFPTRDADLFIERSQLGGRGKSFEGDTYFTAPNPPFGAVFTYDLKKTIETKEKQRRAAEAKLEKAGGNEPARIPALEELRAEEREIEPAIVLVVSDGDGNVVRRVTGPVTAGIHRVAWDLRYPSPSPVELRPADDTDPFRQPPPGPLAAPGKYTVRVFERVNGVETPVGEGQTFNVVPLYLSIFNETDRAAVLDFSKKAARLESAVMGASRATTDALTRVEVIRHTLDQMQNVDPKLVAQVNAVDTALLDIRDEIRGDPILRAHNMPAPPSLLNRVETAVGVLGTTSAPTTTQREALDLAAAEASKMLDRLRTIINTDLVSIDQQLNAAGAPWTPGRVPTLK